MIHTYTIMMNNNMTTQQENPIDKALIKAQDISTYIGIGVGLIIVIYALAKSLIGL